MVVGRLAGGVDEVDGVLADRAIDEHLVAAPLQGDEAAEVDHLVRLRRPHGHPVEDHHLLGGTRVIEDHLHHEAVALGVGELVDALALDRVLRRHDEERPGNLVGVTTDRHLLLAHHLEQRRLHLGRSPVDLVGEQEVDEHRAELDVEALAAAAVDPRADDVGRQEVGRELDAGERAADDVGERLGGERLGQPGDGLEQHVAAGEEGDEQPFEQAALADDDAAHLEEDPLDLLGGAHVVHRRRVVGRHRFSISRHCSRVWRCWCRVPRHGGFRLDRDAIYGTLYGMSTKTTIYLPDELKAAVEREAKLRGSSEAEVIREAIAAAVTRPRPKGGLYRQAGNRSPTVSTSCSRASESGDHRRHQWPACCLAL